MQALTISIANLEDAAALVALINSAYRGEESKKGWTTEANLLEGTERIDSSSLIELINRPGSLFLKCANDSRQLLGSVYLEDRGKELYLGMLSVSPVAQAAGIGKKIMAASEDYAKQHGFTSVIMVVISARIELIDWYIRRGYNPTGKTLAFPSDNKFGTPTQALEFIELKKIIV